MRSLRSSFVSPRSACRSLARRGGACSLTGRLLLAGSAAVSRGFADSRVFGRVPAAAAGEPQSAAW